MKRRQFLAHGAIASVAASLGNHPIHAASLNPPAEPLATRFPATTDDALYAAAARPVLDAKRFIKDPVIIESVELLRVDREHFVRVRAKGGAEGVSVDNGRIRVLHPILTQLIAPY